MLWSRRPWSSWAERGANIAVLAKAGTASGRTAVPPLPSLTSTATPTSNGRPEKSSETKLALEFEPQRGEVRCSWKRWWPWLGHVDFSALAPLKDNKATRLHPLLTRYTHRGRARLHQERWPARTSASRSSRECYAVLNDGPDSTESLHSDGPHARTVSA
ncbi:hypothetical protein HPB50_015292 [Hyalomma asiaticum]|uniref:Uncharacterized protein n=1 Tax=Hyalomma asiaticum TaxID=266040 RepID=A0ACB7RUS5_HYAAI|nr:hypothetical protein HPB50_015292 [Hyalomma asiaticum]